MKQTAIHELRNDLVKAKEKSITILNDMSNEIIRNYCQEAVKLTIESIIERIDDKLLEMEKQQKGFSEDDVNLAFFLGKKDDYVRLHKLINSRLGSLKSE